MNKKYNYNKSNIINQSYDLNDSKPIKNINENQNYFILSNKKNSNIQLN